MTTTRSVSVDTDLMWRHNETLHSGMQVTKPIQKQRKVASKKQASTGTISTTISQMSLASSNPSSRSSTVGASAQSP